MQNDSNQIFFPKVTKMEPRVYHQKKYDEFGNYRIVRTCAYYVTRDGKLRYGGTVYKAENENDKWSRKNHVQKAVDRYWHSPVVCDFGVINDELGYYQYRRLESLLINTMFHKFGVESPNPDYTQVHSLEHLNERLFDQNLTVEEAVDLYNFRESKGHFNQSNFLLNFLIIYFTMCWLILVGRLFGFY